MKSVRRCITALLAMGAAALAIAAAPTAAAAQGEPEQSCVTLGSSTKCTAPGDVEINSSIPAPPVGPWAVYGPFWGGN
jgi:hypothetical protein